jgi:Flp pilus assembly pilin Flp
MSNKPNRKRGQGLVEYIILVTLMGIALIATVKYLGTRTENKFRQAAQRIDGL